MTPLTIVTTSWDDGNPADLVLANVLASHKVPGTFYVPFHGPGGKPTMSTGQLRDLISRGFEIGAHTMSHCVLTQLHAREMRREIVDCRWALEELIETPVRMFCYPCGRYNKMALDLVKEANYDGARTTRMLEIGLRFSRFEMPTSVQAGSHSYLGYLRHLIRRREWDPLFRYITDLHRYPNWVDLGKRLFDRVLQSGGVWHLWGHSWEIDALGEWLGLSELLEHVSRRPGVIYTTNSGAIELLQKEAVVSSLAKAI